MAEPEWMRNLKFGTSTKKDLKEPQRSDFPKGSSGQAQYNLAWAKWDRTSGNKAIRRRTKQLSEARTDVSRSSENLERFTNALDPTNIQKLSLMRRNQISGYRDAAEANLKADEARLLDARKELYQVDPTNFGLGIDSGFDGKLGYNLQGLKINFDYDDPNNQPKLIDAKTAYSQSGDITSIGGTNYIEELNSLDQNTNKAVNKEDGTEVPTSKKEPKNETPKETPKPNPNAGHKNYDAESTAKGTAALSIQKKLLDAGFTQKELNALQENYRNKYGSRFKNLKKKLNIGGN